MLAPVLAFSRVTRGVTTLRPMEDGVAFTASINDVAVKFDGPKIGSEKVILWHFDSRAMGPRSRPARNLHKDSKPPQVRRSL